MLSFLVGAVLASAAAAASIERRDFIKSDNWCGAVNTVSDVTTAEATWTVPTVSVPSTGTAAGKHYVEFQWLGIGGTSTCSSSEDLFQAGTATEIVNGTYKYYPFYELFPRLSQENEDLVVSAGDEIYTKITVTSSTTGTIYWKNISTGKSDTKYLTSDAGRSICQKSVEWIQERPGAPGGGHRPFPNFTSFSMSGVSATTSAGTSVNLAGAQNWVLYSTVPGPKLCHPTVTDNSDITFTQDNEESD